VMVLGALQKSRSIVRLAGITLDSKSHFRLCGGGKRFSPSLPLGQLVLCVFLIVVTVFKLGIGIGKRPLVGAFLVVG
jgi:hypothetical protein